MQKYNFFEYGIYDVRTEVGFLGKPEDFKKN
jgi:hypothetical protein